MRYLRQEEKSKFRKNVITCETGRKKSTYFKSVTILINAILLFIEANKLPTTTINKEAVPDSADNIEEQPKSLYQVKTNFRNFHFISSRNYIIEQ